MTDRYVLVTTSFRGVLMGRITANDGDSVTLENARNCVYWEASVKGVFGLAANGPSAKCRIGPAVPRISLRGVTSVTDCTPEAVKAWEAEPWN